MNTRTALLLIAACAFMPFPASRASSKAMLERFEPASLSSGTFAEDVALTPDGSTMFLTSGSENDPRQRSIVMLRREGAMWSQPRVASFSGQWRDLEEVLTPDGHTMIFASNRPASGSTPIDGFFSGGAQPGRGGNLWSVRWNGTSWDSPQHLPDAVNANTSVFSPAIARDGTLYFMRSSLPGPRFHIYVSKLEDGTYRSSAPAPFGDTQYSDFDPTVAPDGSFVIFGSNRPPAARGTSDLFITFARNGTWSVPQDMGESINPNRDATEPRLSPDARTLYFLSQGKLWSADISAWLAQSQTEPKPQPFAPGILSDALSPTFSPDETTMLFTHSTGNAAVIAQSHKSAGTWSTPSTVSFSGRWDDMDPSFSLDGSYVVFASMRPNGTAPKSALLWRANRTPQGWSDAVLLPKTVNIGANIFAPSLAADGTIYFLHSTPGARAHQLYRARMEDGRYEDAQPLTFSNPSTNDYDPAPSADQSFVIFASSGRNAHDTKRHLYMVYACSSGWGPVHRISHAGDDTTDDSSPVIARDQRTLYFTSSSNNSSQVVRIPIPAASSQERCNAQ